ncbi:MAG: ComF family protein [Candidatus Abyssobacteria bacterium SURF_17]|jgi:ComF family protein|uniref:ComF family protein n=1 Tax=Candidatus Abyssobacteria bacterium SURF_17 TaxID=2093361 RepID=A0A419EXI2_9BACT|nr:MAG: ComF family protein [Candidatus Abyssubacteria bacterium SURF_17]
MTFLVTAVRLSVDRNSGMGDSEQHSAPSTIRAVTGEVFLGLKNLFLPAFCRKCGVRILTEENIYFCRECWSTIELVTEPKCPRCGRPHSRRVGFEPIENFMCSECSAQKLWSDSVHAAGLHADVLRDAVHLLKFKKKRLIAAPLARLLLDGVRGEMDFGSYDVFVTVPLHRNRVKERGYNQVELIAEQLCQHVPELKLQPALRRVKDTPSFSLLRAQERHELIRNAFQVAPDANIKGKKVLLLDDVLTTGATSNECARVLRRAGAQAVDVIALAVARRLD